MLNNSDHVEQLKQISNLYSKKDNQSLTDILSNFSQLSKSYNDFNNKSKKEFNYSSYIYSECSKEEQQEFIDDQLQLVECLVTNSIRAHAGLVWNWYDIYNLLNDPTYANTDKLYRKAVFSTSSTQRPVGDTGYMIWNGLQIIDIDTKDAELALALKPLLFENLKKYNWFLGICLSSSKKSLHVWTKITPITIDLDSRKIEYKCNYRHKYSYIYIIMLQLASKFGYTKEKIIDKYLDNSMQKPQQGIFISSDTEALMNTNFQDLRLDVNFEPAFISGVESINWITHPDLKDMFSKLDWFGNDYTSVDNVEISNISGINDRNISKAKGKQHYKHAQRWQLANTLTSLYGEDKALQIMIEICKNTPKRELAGDVKTASIHNKPISVWAVKELNKQHGFNLNIKSNDLYKTEIAKLDKQIQEQPDENDPIKILNDNTDFIKLTIKHNQYLSDIKDDIIANLSHITLLEAGAGYGKTEMIKSLKAKTMLILPFTSTIKAKVEADEKTSNWLYYYGNKRPTLDEILGDNNMSMTVDKFSRLNVMELDQANFEYIVIDESHLLFTSSYRDVMSPCIQRLANCQAKIIMMTGTPTGELLFFPGIKHIKVVKEDFREKEFEIHMVPTKTEKLIEMCKSMAKDIMNGKKILYPTNSGNLYFEQVTGLIQRYLDLYKYSNPFKAFYYKKSNYGEDSMEDINFEKTVGNNDIVCCSTYLSVGVDICDKKTFSVYFDKIWIPQDIEQFANRIRNNNLYIKLFLETEDSTGFPIDYYHVHPLDLSISQKDLLMARDLIKTCNDMLERNQEESKYNPLIQSLLSANRYLKYDENDCKYYMDETTYKLRVFEERYSDYSKQLKVTINGMKYYGYLVNKIEHTDRVPEDNINEVEEYLKSCRHIRYDYITTQTMKFLDHLNDGNIDVYKELLKGDYAIFKDEEFKEVRQENGLYVEDIEILERNIPIILGLYKFYDCDVIRDIYRYCIDIKQNKLNFAKLGRIRKFVNIEYNRQRRRIDFPVLKFIKDSQKWAREIKSTTTIEVNRYLANYTAKYANSIKDLVVEDTDFLETLYELVRDLWGVIIIQTRPKNGKVFISPFELLWERKDKLTNIYGNLNTKEFFLQELVDNMKVDETILDEELPELELTSKKSLSDIENELPSIVHKEFNYFDYSKLDQSNDRFMKKQESTNSLRDNIFGQLDDQDIPKDESNKSQIIQGELFDDELPF